MKYTYIAIAFLIGAIVAATLLAKPQGFGGVALDGAYAYKNITSADASATVPVQVRGGEGVLGYITVNTTHATIVRVYDGTTATSTGTLIASLPASAVVGTYIYDVAVRNGIVLDVPAGFAGNYTISYK